MAEPVDFAVLKREISLEQVLEHYKLLEAFRPTKKKPTDKRGPCSSCDAPKAFYLYGAENKFYCHSCKAGGSVIDLVMLMEGCTVREAGLKLKHWFIAQKELKDDTQAAQPQNKDLTPTAALKALWIYLEATEADPYLQDALGLLEDIVTTYADPGLTWERTDEALKIKRPEAR